MKVKEISLKDIYPNEFNPNRMPDGTFKKLKHSIEKFGQMNPIIVRYVDKEGGRFEIVDGEWRWRAFKELGFKNIMCREIDATDEEVKQMIFASTIKGKHNAYEAQETLKGFLENSDSKTLSACNLDKVKLERKTKYLNYSKGQAIQKGNKKLVDESTYCEKIDDYKVIFSCTLSKKEHEFVTNYLSSINKDLGKALLQVLTQGNNV